MGQIRSLILLGTAGPLQRENKYKEKRHLLRQQKERRQAISCTLPLVTLQRFQKNVIRKKAFSQKCNLLLSLLVSANRSTEF
jgi:hypothetical protein